MDVTAWDSKINGEHVVRQHEENIHRSNDALTSP